MLYEFCEFFGIQYAIGICCQPRLQEQAQWLQRRLARRYLEPATPAILFQLLYRAPAGLISDASAIRPTHRIWKPTCAFSSLENGGSDGLEPVKTGLQTSASASSASYQNEILYPSYGPTCTQNAPRNGYFTPFNPFKRLKRDRAYDSADFADLCLTTWRPHRETEWKPDGETARGGSLSPSSSLL